MPGATKPFIAVYVVRHPDFAAGRVVADSVYEHFRREIFLNVGGGNGVSVQFRFSPAVPSVVPLPIEPDEAETSAIVVFLESRLVNDKHWVAYVQSLARMANARGLSVRVFPIIMEPGLTTKLKNPLARIQSIRWDKWSEPDGSSKRRKLLVPSRMISAGC